MATKRRFLTQYSPQHRYSLASFSNPDCTAFIKVLYRSFLGFFVFLFGACNAWSHCTIRFIKRYFSFPLIWSRRAGLMGLTLHYRLIPKHTARWRKACSSVGESVCVRLCSILTVSQAAAEVRPSFAFCLLCELVWMYAGKEALRFPPVLYKYPAANPLFMCPQLSMLSITIRLSAPWRQLVFRLFFYCPSL